MLNDIDALNALLKPQWGTERYILEGWQQLNVEEKSSVALRLEQALKDDFLSTLKHDKNLYLYLFSLLAQFAALSIPLTVFTKQHSKSDSLKKAMHGQLVDRVFHAILFTKTVYLLATPYSRPPQCSETFEKIVSFIQTQESAQVGIVLLNLVTKGLVEEVLISLHKNDIAPQLLKAVLEDEKRHCSEEAIYAEVGLPEKEILSPKIATFEEFLVSIFLFQPQYLIALGVVLGPKRSQQLLVNIKQKYSLKLQKIDLTPSDNLELAYHILHEMEVEKQLEENSHEIFQEFQEVEMSPVQKGLMTQFHSPGDPTLVAQFNIDISRFGFFDDKFPRELLTILMMQAVSEVLSSHDAFRNFLSFKKLYCSRASYVALLDTLPDGPQHLGVIYFRDCHTIECIKLFERVQRSKRYMQYCYQKRQEIEKEHPHIKEKMDTLLYQHAHDLYEFPTAGHHSVYISNVGQYGYSHAKVPLPKHAGLHISLLAVERKPVWNEQLKSFENQDLLPIAISADSRVFDGQLALPRMLNAAFQEALRTLEKQTMQSKKNYQTADREYNQLLDKIAERIVTQKNITHGGKIIAYLKNKKILIQKAQQILGDEIDLYGKKLSYYTQFDNIANQLILDYLGFDTELARQNEKLGKIIDKMVEENAELTYRILYGMQSAWVEYQDVETSFSDVYEKLASNRLLKLSKWLPNFNRGEGFSN